MLIDTTKFKCQATECLKPEASGGLTILHVAENPDEHEVYCENCGGRIFEEEKFSDEIEVGNVPTEEQEKEMQTKTVAHFFRELKAEDPDDFHVLDIRIAALAEELGKDAQNISLKELDGISRAVKDES